MSEYVVNERTDGRRKEGRKEGTKEGRKEGTKASCGRDRLIPAAVILHRRTEPPRYNNTAVDYFKYGSVCALAGWGVKVAILYGWQSLPFAIYAPLATSCIYATNQVYVETVKPRRKFMQRSFEARLAAAAAAAASKKVM